MRKVGIISDTHCCFDEKLQTFLADVDEIWHAGDFGSIETADQIGAFKPLRGVYGNIDGGKTRLVFKEFKLFECEGVKVLMTHIGGHPSRYDRNAQEYIRKLKPGLFICGHSHILKVQYDKKNSLLYINPGAAGCSGFHKVRTAIRMVIDDGNMKDLEVGEWTR